LNLAVCIGKSKVYSDLTQFHHAYTECEKALRMRLLMPSNNIITAEQIDISEYSDSLPVELEQEILSLIEFGESDAEVKFENYVNQMVASNFNPNYIYCNCISLIMDIIKITTPMGISADEFVEQSDLSLEKMLQFKRLDELKLYMCTIIGKAIVSIHLKRSKKLNHMIVDICQYIDTHYNEDIPLKLVANRYFLNPTYLSQLFKKNTGKTFLEYLTNLRLERAKSLLLNTDYMVYEIANMVGYTSQRYFSDLFEKYYGCKPTLFKKKK